MKLHTCTNCVYYTAGTEKFSPYCFRFGVAGLNAYLARGQETVIGTEGFGICGLEGKYFEPITGGEK